MIFVPDGGQMCEPMVIPCELRITPGGGRGRQNKLRLSVSGETVFDEWEQSLSPEQKAVIGQIAQAQARLLAKYGADLQPCKQA